MYQVSDDFKKFICDSGRELLVKVEADLASGKHLTLDNYDLLESGFEIEDAVSESDKFQVGAAIINQLTLALNNFEDKTKGNNLSNCDFTGAVLRPYVGLVVKKDWHGDTVEWVPKGVFTAEKPTAAGSRITVTALDNMAKLDTAYSKSTLAYPATLGQIAADVCSVCGVTLATTTFPNSTYSVAKRPSGDLITCREVLSYVARLAGCFARCNSDGAAEIRWYTENDALYDVGTGASSASIADADTAVAGVQIQGSDNTVYSSGADGFVVRIQDNPLAQDGLQAIADALGVKFNGYTFRAYTASSPSNPAVEAGDVVNMTDSKGVTHKTVVSRLTYEIDGNEEYNGDAETTDENQSERFTAAQKAQEAADTAQQTADEAKAEIELANVTIGNLTVRVTATEEGLSSKVSKDDMASEIQQHADAVILAFNGQSAVIKAASSGFDYYLNGSKIGHTGTNDVTQNGLNRWIEISATDSAAGVCIIPARGGGLYLGSPSGSGYGLMYLGNAKFAGGVASDGLISTTDFLQGRHKSSAGAVGKTESVPVTMGDGSTQNLIFQDGLYVSRN